MWHFEWVELSQEVELLVRYRFENTLDKMQKPYTEFLAYMTGEYKSMAPEKHWEWKAFLNGGNELVPGTELSFDYKALRIEVEEYFRSKPDEENTVPSSAV